MLSSLTDNNTSLFFIQSAFLFIQPSLLQSEQSLQASIYTREAHEGKTEESGCNHHNGYALHTLRNADQCLLLTNAGKDDESQDKAEGCRERINHTLQEIVVLLDNQDGYTQHSTVGSNQRQEDAKCLIKRRRNLLENNLYHLNQGGNHEDERQGLEILQSEWIEYILLDRKSVV